MNARMEALSPYHDAIAEPPAADAAAEFWRAALRGFSHPTPIGADWRPSAAGETRYGESETQLAPALTAGLFGAAERHGLRLETLLRAAWALTLFRFSGQADVLFGAAGRRGLVAVRASLAPGMAGVRWLRRFQADQDAAERHAAASAEQLRAWCGATDSPLFESLLVSGVGQEPPAPPGHADAAEPPCPLIIEARAGAALRLTGRYNSRRFAPAAIERLIFHLRTVLERMAADCDQPIHALSAITDSERRQIAAWNPPGSGGAPAGGMLQWFEDHAARQPQAPALIDGERRISYGELNQRANRLARYLRGLGVGPESLVGIAMLRTVDLVVGLLGILKSGGGYVPLDPLYPHDRLAFMLADAGAAVLLTQDRLRGLFADYRGLTVCLDSAWPTIAREAADDPPPLTRSQHLAYLIYTSGSTGKPKGVAITHGNASAFIQWAGTIVTPEELSGVLAATSICFDLSVFEIFVPLSLGGTVILAENALLLPILPARGEVTLINTVPALIAELVKRRAVPDSALTINLAGEPLKRALVDQIYQTTNARRVLNLYGPSEDTTYSTIALVERDDRREPAIGVPIANSAAFILDRQFDPVPIGVVGELYLAGDGLARGYFNRPDLTAERFLPHPWSAAPGARLYRTGDLARYRADGQIEHLGRSDHQVKLRGYRIELGEIEAALQRHQAVQSAVVIARNEAGGPRLVAYLEARGDRPGDRALRSFLAATLPDYMLPAVFVWLEALPLLPNGKVDRAALPQPPSLES